MYIPVALPSTRLPSYVHLDASSEWHKSALIMTAWESMTLLSRFRSSNTTRETLGQLESTLNINGNQNIARLQLTIAQNAKTNGDMKGIVSRAHNDLRIASNVDVEPDENGDNNVAGTPYEMDFLAIDLGDQSRERRSSQRNHVFGQAQNVRADTHEVEVGKSGIDDLGYERARRRAAGLTITRRYVIISARYTLSFPQITTSYMFKILCNHHAYIL